jgi:hypothetical protein
VPQLLAIAPYRRCFIQHANSLNSLLWQVMVGLIRTLQGNQVEPFFSVEVATYGDLSESYYGCFRSSGSTCFVEVFYSSAYGTINDRNVNNPRRNSES